MSANTSPAASEPAPAVRPTQLAVGADSDAAISAFVALEERIDGAEGDAIMARWEFGRALLAERVGKQLPKGRLALIVTATGKSQREIGFRLRFAEHCSSREEVCTAVQTYKSWTAIREQLLPSDRVARNAAGAHEGADLSDGDAEGDGWKLLLGDFRERLLDLPDGSVNLIVTDPPYPAEYLPLWDDLGREASRLLTKGGVLLARCGHLFLPDVLASLAAHLRFGWLYAEPLPGSNVRFLGRHVAVSFQPWVAFSNGDWPSSTLDWHPDLLSASPRTKARYVWEQKPTIAAELIATFAAPGHDVLDPFAGSGAYGEAALGVGCRWLGVEVDPAGHAQAAARMTSIE